MTRNQLQYWELEEKKRANRVAEAEMERAHRANEDLLARQASTQELNAQTNIESLKETQRSNRATQFETHRTNVARENETERSNRAKEDLEQQLRNIQNFGNYLEEGKLKVLTQQAGIAAGQLHETIRSNQAQEALQNRRLVESERSALAQEAETHRANLARESNNSLQTLYSRLNKLTDKEIADANLTQTQIRDLDNLRLGLYQVLIDSQQLNINQQNADSTRMGANSDISRSNIQTARDILQIGGQRR